MRTSLSWRSSLIAVAILLCVQMGTLYLYGNPPVCACGHFAAWEGGGSPLGNSQALADWYTFLHITQGFISYLILWYFFPELSVPLRFLIAVGVQFGWELVENSPWMIVLYRTQAMASTYLGDSMPNSFTDTFSVIVGFIAAWRIPIMYAVFLCVVLDAVPLIMIHDDLLLGLLNFVYHVPAVEAWQVAGQ